MANLRFTRKIASILVEISIRNPAQSGRFTTENYSRLQRIRDRCWYELSTLYQRPLINFYPHGNYLRGFVATDAAVVCSARNYITFLRASVREQREYKRPIKSQR